MNQLNPTNQNKPKNLWAISSFIVLILVYVSFLILFFSAISPFSFTTFLIFYTVLGFFTLILAIIGVKKSKVLDGKNLSIISLIFSILLIIIIGLLNWIAPMFD